ANLACVLFNICMSTFIGSDQSVGKIIAVDEAHQYMINTPGATMLTDSILTLIREQRHYG
ncbi:MAG: hypothetical protein M1817_004729, partial [Caeruleum heppii]